MITSAGGCDKQRTKGQAPPLPANHPLAVKQAQRPAEPSTGQSNAPVTPPDPVRHALLSSEERTEFESLSGWINQAAWSRETSHDSKLWETDQAWKRQRPVGLIVLNPDDLLGSKPLKYTIPTAMEYARGLAHANWDVKILLHMTGAERCDLTSLKAVRDAIADINKGIEDRNREEAAKLPDGVAPLRPIDAPAMFKDKQSLEDSIERWLAKSFLDGRKPYERDDTFGRPPFGGISFSGHGRTVKITEGAQGRERLSLPISQFKVAEKEWFDLSKLEAVIFRRYQAPVWLMTDLCRNLDRGFNDPAEVKDPIPRKLDPRKFGNILRLGKEVQDAINACESLRGTASSVLSHHGSGVSTLNAAKGNLTVVHERNYLLHSHFGEMIERAIPAGDFMRAVFKNVPNPTTSITLLQAKEWTTDRQLKEWAKAYQAAKEQGSELPPEPQLGWSPGTFSDNVVVFSTLRGKDVYPPQFPNLLNGGISFANGGFAVPEFANGAALGGEEHYGAVSLVHTQEVPDKTEFKSIFRFKEPFVLNSGTRYQVVLLVSATGGSRESIKFTAGVYDTEHNLLNPSFQEYGTAESYRSPVMCDGDMRLVHVPLTWFNDPAADPKPDVIPKPEIAEFEIQAAPDDPESNWGLGLTLKVHGVYLLEESVIDEQLMSGARRVGSRPYLINMCIWDVLLHADKPESVSIHVGESGTSLTQSTENFTGLWGAAGEIYPKLYAEPGRQHIRIKIDIEDPGRIRESSEAFFYVCSNTRVMATWKASLKDAAAREKVVQIIDPGLIQEVVMMIRNHDGPVKIGKLDIEDNPAGNK